MKLCLDRKLNVLLVMFLLLTGCQDTKSVFPDQMSTPKPTMASINYTSNSPLPTVSILPQSIPNPYPENHSNVEPIVISQVGFESGKPKEESNVTDSGQKSIKISHLKPIYSVSKGTVAITIDDGPTKYTEQILQLLKEKDIHVTFFFLGQNAAAYPKSVTEAAYDGDEIGYHSNSHPKMTRMNMKDQETEYELGLTKLKRIDPNPITLFRPPYGAYNNDTKVITEEHKMKMVLWNEDPRDWSTTDPAVVVNKVLSEVHSGSIIVIHDRLSTIKALPDIITGIEKKGLKLVIVSS